MGMRYPVALPKEAVAGDGLRRPFSGYLCNLACRREWQLVNNATQRIRLLIALTGKDANR